MSGTIIVLLDGLKYATARSCMSFMLALEEAALARGGKISSCLPPLSRPAYASILSGLNCGAHGIFRNDDSRPLADTIFSAASSAGLVTCAAAYGWIYELCNRKPFIAGQTRFHNDVKDPIAHGIFYTNDSYPDDELFADAECLRKNYSPSLLLAHSMGIDYAGHSFGGDSPQYRNAARNADSILAHYAPAWLEAGYNLLVLSDHGMGDDCCHYDATAACLETPVWIAGSKLTKLPANQRDIAPLVAGSLNIPWPPRAE